MKKRNNISKFTAVLLALITFFTSLSFPLVEIYAAQKPVLSMEMPPNGMKAITPKGSLSRMSTFSVGGDTYFENQKLQIENAAGQGLLISIDGANDTDNFAPAQVTWRNPITQQEYQAYCVNAAYKGYGDIPDYDISVIKFDDTIQFSQGKSNGNGHMAGDIARDSGITYQQALWGAVNYGYPTRTAEQVLGGSAESYGVSKATHEYAAYVATKFAIWAIVHNNYDINSWNTFSGSSYPQALKNDTLNAQKEIYNYAMNFQGVAFPEVSFTAGQPKADPVKKIYETIYTIDNANVVANTDMYLRMDENYSPFPDGMVIKDMNDNPLSMGSDTSTPQYIVPSGTTQFKVIVPIPAEETYSKNYSLMLFAQTAVKTLVFGKASDPNVQDYILAGNGYANPSAPFTIESSGGNDIPTETPPPGGTDIPTETPKTGKIKVIKLDARDNATPLAGATFDLYNSQGQLVDTGTTNSSGIWIPTVTAVGSYTVVERSTNTSYQLTEPITLVILVEENRETTATFRNFPKQDIPVYKEDAITGEPIQGVQYEIYQIDGKGAWRAVAQTDSQGRIVFEDVPDGTYLVREVSTVGDYILDPTPQHVTVRNGQSPSLKFLNSKHPSLNIVKLDRQAGSVITNPATFLIEQISGSYSEYVTTSGGTISIKDLPVGSFKITETSAPTGYVIDSTPETVHLGAGESHTVYMYNLKAPVLTIEKIDAQTGQPIPGTKFEIKKSDGTIIGTVTTGANGKVTVGLDGGELGYLDPDVYTVTEVFVPAPYVLSHEHQDIRLNGGDTKSLFFGNLEMPRIIIEKYDEQTAERLPNAQFAIYEQHDLSRPVIEGLTNENGQLNSGYIKEGTYVIKEINPPFGYMFSDKTEPVRTIVAKAGDGDILVKFDNIKLPELTIRKIDSITGEPIEGVTYSIAKTDDSSVQPSTATTDANGLIVVPNLEAGTYTVTEIFAPSRYILNSIPQYVKLDGGEVKALLFENTLYPTLVVHKWNAETLKGVANTTFLIERENANGTKTTMGTYRTDADGYIVLPFVDTGWYVLTETIPAQGMQSPTNPVTSIYLAAGTNSYTDYSDGNVGGNSDMAVTSGLDYPVIGDIVNYPLNSIVIKKSDANTGEMLSGATFEVIKVTGQTSGQNGTLICTVTTDISGVIVITGLEAGAYTVREIKAPTNYFISETNMQSVNLKADGTSIVEVLFNNLPYGHILISKVDALTNKPLANARFKVTDGAGTAAGNSNGEYVTDENGEILISNLEPKAYVITEIEAPENYAIDTTPQTVQVGTDGGTYKVSFKNQPYASIVINKYDYKTKAPLSNAKFLVTTSAGAVFGSSDGIYTTDAKGTIKIPNVPKDSYVIEEIQAPDGYILENQTQVIAVDYGKTYTVDFYNKEKSGLQIIKIDSQTKQPLKDAQFTVYRQNGEVMGIYTTDKDGVIILNGLDPDWYKIVETKAPDGYILDDAPKDIQITDNQFLKITFENKKLTSLVIKKIDETGAPLSGALFYVETINGTHVGEYTTDSDGLINIPELLPDWYVVREQKAPYGYLLDESPKTVEIKTNIPTVISFTNYKLTSLIIKKVDEITGAPLSGAQFRVEKQDGTRIGDIHTTDGEGLITISTLAPDFYVVREVEAPANYILDETPKTVEVKTVSPTIVTFSNKPLAGLQIKKINSETRQPISGVTFGVYKLTGEKIGEDFKTDASGLIYISSLEPDFYTVRELKAADGYILDSEPKTVQVKWGENTHLEVENTPISGLLITKTDIQTKKPLQGVKFDIAKINGEIIGTYTTDKNGQIHVNSFSAGLYTVVETEALKGYELDTTVHEVEIFAGKQTKIEITNKALSGLKLLKIDSITKEPIFNVEFMIFDTNGKVVATAYTDNNGVIDLAAILVEGRYTLRETRAAESYYRDDIPRTVEFISGKYTEVVWENIPEAGQIQVLKLSADDNETNGLPAGTPLQGAIFEVYSYKSGNLVDRFITGYNGQGVSKVLPLGRYLVKEIQAPPYYKLNDKQMDITIEFATQIVKMEYTNHSANLGVSIDKVAPKEVMPGQEIVYSIKKIRNDSSVALSDYYYRDTLPTDAIRLERIVTGTFNMSLKYKITVTTNKGNTMVIADNLKTTQNNVVDCTNASLGLSADEYVTSFTVYFGQVPSGFTSVEEPKIYGRVLNKTFPNGYIFSNKADIGGMYQGEWVIGGSTAPTTIYSPTPTKLPKTGK